MFLTKNKIFWILSLIFFGIYWFNSGEINLDDANSIPIFIKDYKIVPKASFKVRARVLSREDYSWSKGSSVMPMDVALGWRRCQIVRG